MNVRIAEKVINYIYGFNRCTSRDERRREFKKLVSFSRYHGLLGDSGIRETLIDMKYVIKNEA